MLTVNNAPSYVAFGQQFVDPAEANTATRIGVAGTLGNLQIVVTTPPGAGTWTFSVVQNGVATALSCNFTGAVTTCSNNTPIVVLATDTIDLEAAPSATPATPTHVSWSATVTP